MLEVYLLQQCNVVTVGRVGVCMELGQSKCTVRNSTQKQHKFTTLPAVIGIPPTWRRLSLQTERRNCQPCIAVVLSYFAFHKVVRRHYSGEAGDFTIFWCEISSGFCTRRFIFLPSYSKHKGEGVIFWRQCMHVLNILFHSLNFFSRVQLYNKSQLSITTISAGYPH